MATLYFTAPGGDELRILDFDSRHPHLQVEGAAYGDWRDVPPKLYPNALFSLAVTLIQAASDSPLRLALADAGLRVEED
jgi:hypothetical protein